MIFKPVKSKIMRYKIEAGDDFNYKVQPYLVKFETPQRAVAPGQSAVLYKDNVIIGGGVIARAIK